MLAAAATDNTIALVIALIAAVAALALLAEKLRLPYPILLVIGGLFISLIPNLPSVSISPTLVFYVFLPPILYWAGLMTSWRDFVQNIRPILLLAVGAVLMTTFAVAGVAYALVPGMTFAAACVLGAIVSPPDAVAATTVTGRMTVPRRITSILEGESLVNDATALVALAFAITAVRVGTFSLPAASLQFIYLAVGGTAIGLIVGWLATHVRKRIHTPHVDGVISLLTPYFAYLPAEAAHTSGVLAAVAAGVFMSRQLPKAFSAESRMRQASVWETLIFILNGTVFILIGLHLPVVVTNLRGQDVSVGALIVQSLVISAAAIGVRMLWIFATAWASRLIPGLATRDPFPSAGVLVVIGWAGMRGIVSLAAALAVPLTISADTPFPARDKIIFITFVVILVTLVLQGLTLPLVIRWAKLAADGSQIIEERQARLDAAHAAMSRLSVIESEDNIDPVLIERVRNDYADRIKSLGGTMKDAIDPTLAAPQEQARHVRQQMIDAERAMITMLRDQRVIGDDVLRQILREIDLEEAKLT